MRHRLRGLHRRAYAQQHNDQHHERADLSGALHPHQEPQRTNPGKGPEEAVGDERRDFRYQERLHGQASFFSLVCSLSNPIGCS